MADLHPPFFQNFHLEALIIECFLPEKGASILKAFDMQEGQTIKKNSIL